jgi:mRNA guanylyltransferase
MDHSGGGGTGPFQSPIATPNTLPSPSLANLKFCGCMPVNFSRHDLDKIQNSTSGGYFCSEKTDGVRHFMIFTGDTVVLVDRAMRGKQPKWLNPAENSKDNKKEPMAHVLDLIQPGTVLDGEVVIHRGGANHKARPVFIVFDVMTISPTKPVLQETFEKRLRHLNQASFRTASANRDMFDVKYLSNSGIPLPLIRKNFVKRTQLEELFSHVIEEKGLRSYRNGEVHNHLTDGIIFQPNLPYVCGTDVNLLKWKYLDTVTIDVELLPPRPNHRHHGGGGDDDDEEVLRVGVLGEEQTMVDMSRYVQLPKSERYRLQADRREAGNARITEVGFDPETGEWYYKGMRPDKVAPNHISTVLGTLLELSESLTPEELQYRLSIPDGQRDTYRKDVRKMLKQLLDHQKQQRRQPPPPPPPRR